MNKSFCILISSLILLLIVLFPCSTFAEDSAIERNKKNAEELKSQIEIRKKEREKEVDKAIEERKQSEQDSQDLLAASTEIEETLRARNANKILNPIMIGDFSSKVLENYGKPTTVNRTVTKYGVNEQWVYADGVYIYFENDLVVAWQDQVQK